MSGFDFATTQVKDEVRVLDVVVPGTTAVAAKISLLSLDADKPTEVRRRQEKRRLSKPRATFRIDPVELESDSLDLLAACTVSWEGVKWQGTDLECNYSNARMLYEAIPWLRSEVDRFVGDVTNFLAASQETSQPS